MPLSTARACGSLSKPTRIHGGTRGCKTVTQRNTSRRLPSQVQVRNSRHERCAWTTNPEATERSVRLRFRSSISISDAGGVFAEAYIVRYLIPAEVLAAKTRSRG